MRTVTHTHFQETLKEVKVFLLKRKDMPQLPLIIAMWETEAQNSPSFGIVISPSSPAKKRWKSVFLHEISKYLNMAITSKHNTEWN